MAGFYYESLARRIYEYSEDMDGSDYVDYQETEVELLADELQKMDKAGSVVFRAIENIDGNIFP